MSLLLGIGAGVAQILQDLNNNGKLTNYDSEEAAKNAQMPPLQSNQKAVIVTATVDGETTPYLKVGNSVEPLVKG